MNKGNTVGLYFPLSKGELNDLRARLNYQFGKLGYADEDSKPPYRGGLPAGLMAIDKGEIALVLLPDEQRSWVREWLYQQADALEKAEPQSMQDFGIILALVTIADALTEAIDKQVKAEEE